MKTKSFEFVYTEPNTIIAHIRETKHRDTLCGLLQRPVGQIFQLKLRPVPHEDLDILHITHQLCHKCSIALPKP